MTSIILPRRISSSSTLIDNIFCNLTHTTNAPPSKYNIYKHDSKKIDEEKFILVFNSQDWDNILVLDKENVNETIDSYLQNLNNLLEKYAPLKKLNKQERKFQQNPWITKISIKKKSSIF